MSPRHQRLQSLLDKGWRVTVPLFPTVTHRHLPLPVSAGVIAFLADSSVAAERIILSRLRHLPIVEALQ